MLPFDFRCCFLFFCRDHERLPGCCPTISGVVSQSSEIIFLISIFPFFQFQACCHRVAKSHNAKPRLSMSIELRETPPHHLRGPEHLPPAHMYKNQVTGGEEESL
jgi:hypothetical protein